MLAQLSVPTAPQAYNYTIEFLGTLGVSSQYKTIQYNTSDSMYNPPPPPPPPPGGSLNAHTSPQTHLSRWRYLSIMLPFLPQRSDLTVLMDTQAPRPTSLIGVSVDDASLFAQIGLEGLLIHTPTPLVGVSVDDASLFAQIGLEGLSMYMYTPAPRPTSLVGRICR